MYERTVNILLPNDFFFLKAILFDGNMNRLVVASNSILDVIFIELKKLCDIFPFVWTI